MKFEIDTGFTSRDQGECGSNPYARIKIDMSAEELHAIRKEDKDLYFYLTRLIKRGLTEADKGVQVFSIRG